VVGINENIQILAYFYIQEFDQINDQATYNLLNYNSGGEITAEWMINPRTRVRAGLTHAGSLNSEGVPYNPLFTQGTLVNSFNFRAYYDFFQKLRFTLDFDPIFRSNPDLQWLVASQAIEYFPFNAGRIKPFAAIGSTQRGVSDYSANVAFNAKIGVATANPFTSDHELSGRAIVGF